VPEGIFVCMTIQFMQLTPRTHICRKILDLDLIQNCMTECLSVTNVDLIAALTLKMVELTILDISLEHVDLWLNIHFLASICYYE